MDIRRVNGLCPVRRSAGAGVDGDVGAVNGGQDAGCVESGGG